MADNNQKNPRPVTEKNPDQEKNIINRRRVTERLPALLNTDLIKKFFAGSGDHLFQPEVSEKLAGFIGKIPAHFEKGRDFYIDEPTRKRRDHQLEPTTISTDLDTGALTNIMFYEDILNLLRFQGGLVNNQDRLFDTEFYSWAPCIDLDKIMNFTNYFWFPAGPDVVRINVSTNIGGELGTSDPVVIDGIEFFDGMRVVFENDVDILFNDRVFIVDGIGVSFNLLLETELFQYLWDDPLVAWDDGPWDGPAPELAISFDTPDYIVIQRDSRDQSSWSIGNRWYHRDELNDTQFSIALERQAQRPIIEFCKNLELFNHGTFGRAPVTVRDDITTDPDLQLIGLINAPVIDGITISNGDIILFTNSPSLQGTWDVGPWDNEDAPDGEWDEFINIVYSAPALDIILGLSTITTIGADFVALGFVPGMKIILNGTPAQDGEHIIDTVNSSVITLTEPFVNTTGIGVPIPNNMTIIEQRTLFQNRVFKVDGIGTPGGLTLTLIADGQNSDGSPTDGDQIKVLLGLVHQGNSYYWNDADDEWLLAQQKNVINQSPLFQLYDTEATKLQDPGKYPSSNFAGSKLFSYQINDDPRQPLDAVLGIPLKFNELGEIVFQNHLVTDRFNFSTPAQEILGFYFHRRIGETSVEDIFNNDWHRSKIKSRQFLIDKFITDDDTRDFDLTLTPDNEDEVQVFVNGDEKTDQRWSLVDNQIQFFDFFENDDILQVRYFSTDTPEAEDTTYEIPINLEGNPDNEEVEFIANSEFFAHFTSIIKNQEGLVGNPNGTNNWRETLQDKSIGTEILQHQAPMLKLMSLGSNRNIDFMLSVRFVEREFSRFRNKFLRKINEFVRDGIHNDAIDPPSLWVEDALSSINLGKTTDFPFAFSGMGIRANNEPTFIPSSPSRLGVFPVFKPEIFEDRTFQTPQNVIQMHDGSIIIAFNDFRDDVILELENNIFDSIPEEYKTEELTDFTFIDFVEAEFREGEYSLEEFNQLLTPIIQRWATFHNFDLAENDVFDQNDPFTFNYGKQGLPGYWRGIFRLFYDTDKPNTHPWEMFGFSQKPDYWDARYGLPPYTSTNTLLWDDMRIGTIAGGTRQGVDERFSRLTAPIPVDAVGDILDPIALGIATRPGIIDAMADWKIGDHAPVETVFRRGEFWSFAIAQISYLMKPARFIELGWDPKLQLFRYEDDPAGSPQWISSDTEDRKRHSEITVHGEELPDKTIFTSDGIQQWITNFVVSNGQSITDIFGNVIRGLQPRLGHKMAGFINSNATRILADNFGLVPQEDIGVNLYRNRSIREEIYSGVIIERVGKGWAVFGYDVLDPAFKIIPPVKTSRQIAIDIGTIRVSESTLFKNDQIQEIPYGTEFQTQQEVYDFLISYGKFLESRGWIFDEVDTVDSKEVNNWRLSGKQYLFWSLGRWAVGSLISLSPSATKIKFKTERGAIQSIEQIINGVYSLLDRDGRVIQPEQTFVTRFNDELTIVPEEEQAIYSARLFIAEFEHVLTFNNKTIFNDLIYNPLLKLRQSRFKVFTTRAGGWVGRFDAPGFIITENNLLPNYEKITNDFRRYFEIEDVVERPAIQDTARRLFGFQTRDYLSNLLLSDDTQFQFMQGFIRKKGTSEVLDRLLRSDATTDAEELQFFEEWALRLGEYGAIQDSITVELLVKEEEIKANPQLIEFKGSILRYGILASDLTLTVTDASNFPDSAVIKIDDEILFYTSKLGNNLNELLRGQKGTEAAIHLSGEIVSIEDNLFDDVLLIAPNDERWLRRAPDDENVTFPFRDLTNTTLKRINGSYLLRTDIRIAGYPLESEVTHRVQTIAERNDLFDDLRVLATDENLAFGDTVWVDRIGNFYSINDPDNLTDDDPRAVFNFEFMVFRYTSLFGNTVDILGDPLVVEWEIAEVAIEEGDPIDISTTLSDPHGLNNGDLVMIDNVSGVTPSLIGSFLVSDIGFSFDGDGATDTFATGGATLHLNPTITNTVVKLNGITQVHLIDYEIGGGEITEQTGTPGATYVNGETIGINGVFVTLDEGTSVNNAVADINAAAITNIEAENIDETLVIRNTVGESLTLAEGSGTALVDLGFNPLLDVGFGPGVTATTGNNIRFLLTTPILSDTITIRRENHFRVNVPITNIDEIDLSEATIGIFTEARFLTETDRDAFLNPRGISITRNLGEHTFIDNASTDLNGLDLWTVFEYDSTTPWKVVEFDNVTRIQNKRVDVELFEQALVYNRDTNITDIRLSIWDPAKNLFPAQTLKEIDFKLEFNPAKYTNGDESLFQIDPDQSWGEEHVGEVWWDLSTVEYTNYETSSNRERRNKWGRIAPGKSIDIYEWVRSTVPPTEWADLVESVEEQPEESFRYKPSGEAFEADEVENPPFSQRIVVNQLTGEEEIFFYFWVKNSETIPTVENRDLSVAQVARQLTDPTGAGIPWFAPINQNAMIVSNTKPFLTNDDSVLQLTFNSKRSEVNRHRDWVLTREGDEKDVPTDRFWEKMKDSLVSFDRNNDPVPAPNLEESRKIGNFIRPRQTWFTNREQAGKIFIDCVNLLLSQECIVDTRTDLFNNLFNKSNEPTKFVAGDKTVCQYDFHVANNEERNALFVVPGLTINDQIWVDGIVETEGFWKVYSFDGTDVLGKPIFTEICSESFRVADFWQQVDFFTEGFDISTEADVIVDTLAERDAIPNPNEGILVKVNDSNSDSTNLFALYEFNSSDTFNPWVLVGKEDCTIEFDIDLFFDSNYGNVDVLTGLDGRDQALKEVIDALRNDILTDLEQNLLFFKMIRYVHSEQLLVDWVFKTTYIKAVGLNQTADQNPIFKPDTTQDLISYIEEAKPYHTKLRDFVINQDIGFDIHETNVTDFDKPVAFDTLLDDFRVLDPNDPDDIEIMLDPDARQNDWFLNFQSNPDLIRQINTTIKFDRVSCGLSTGWDPIFGWDFGPNEDWDLALSDVTETAAERIAQFYQPHPLAVDDIDLINEQLARIVIEEKDIAELISGCKFKGTFVDGAGMIIDINDIDTFLNPSQSAFFDGDGIEDTFAIPTGSIPPTVENTKVFLVAGGGWSINDLWSNSLWSSGDAADLQVEGVDYTFNTTEVVFTIAPPNGSQIIIIVGDGLLANPGAPTGPADIIVDGNLLNDPFTEEGHPEELVLQTTGEALSICVDTEESAPAPAIAFRLFLDNQNAKEALDIKPLIKTTLSENITAGQTTIKVNDIARFPPFGKIVIVTKSTLGNFTIVENIEYDSVDKLTKTLGVVLDGRGVNNTIPAEHFLGDIVLVLNPLIPEIATFDSFRISDAGKTTLAQPLVITDTEIELASVAGLPKQLVNQEFMTKPGVIWIGNERIEYFRRDYKTLKHIRRGTKGTSSGIPSIYDSNGDLISDFRTGTLIYAIDTEVTDGTKKQEIPGGYEWVPESNGLQFSDSIQAKFLLDKPGSCPEPVDLAEGWSSSLWSGSPRST